MGKIGGDERKAARDDPTSFRDNRMLGILNDDSVGCDAGACFSKGSGQFENAIAVAEDDVTRESVCLLYTSPSPRDQRGSRMPSSA